MGDSPLHLATKPSTHSLYPMCEIKRSPSVLSEARGSVPLADMNREMNISSLSIVSNGERDRGVSEEHIDHSEQIIVLGDDNDVSYELIQLKGKDEEDDGGSDSGYSGRSPDGTIRDSKSPSSEVDVTDRKSSFSDDVSEEEQEEEEIPRQAMSKQRSRFQTPGKEILQSQESQEAVAVLREDTSDGIPRARVRLPETRVVLEETYGRPVVRGERVPVRAEAQGEHGEMNMGCYYLMAALDFCWCL